jgi:hypothetical protein
MLKIDTTNKDEKEGNGTRTKGSYGRSKYKGGVICRHVGKAEQLANILRVTLDSPKVEGPMK